MRCDSAPPKIARMPRLVGSAKSRDAVLALLVFALGEAQLTAGNLHGPRVTGTVAAALYGGSMLVWRTRPWTVLIVVFVTVVASAYLGVEQQGPYGTMAAGFVAVYGVASREPLRRSLAGLAFALGMVYWSAHQYGLWNYAFAWFLLGGALVVGRALQSRRVLIEQLRSTMCQLETTMQQLEVSREENARAAVADERVKIARELHDVVAHAISVIVIQAGAAEEILDVQPQRARAPLQAVQESARQALAELRRLLAVLRPDATGTLSRSPQPGLADLNALARNLGAAGLSVVLHQEGLPPSPLPAGVDLAAYRIVQEALTNVLKHAATAAAHVSVRYLDDAVEVEVVDDGAQAPERPAAEARHGLIGMRERAVAYGGELEAGSRDGGGYVVKARLLVSASG